MKNYILSILVVTLAIMSCESPDPISDEELLTKEVQQESLLKEAAKEFVNSKEFQQILKEKKSINSLKQSDGNGAIFIQGNTFGFFPHYFDNGVVVFAVFFRPNEVKILPNGIGEFNLESQNPFVIYADYDNGLDLISNGCIESESVFRVKYKGEVQISTDFFGNENYRVVAPLATPYMAKAWNVNVNDAEEYNPITDEITCRDNDVMEINFDMSYIEQIDRRTGEIKKVFNLRQM